MLTTLRLVTYYVKVIIADVSEDRDAAASVQCEAEDANAKVEAYAFDGLDASDEVLDDLCDAILAMNTVQKPPFRHSLQNADISLGERMKKRCL